MQFIWLLPSLAVATYFGATTGSWYLVAMSCASAIAWFAQAKVREIQNLDFNQPITLKSNAIWVGAKRLPKWRWLWRKEWDPYLHNYFESRSSRLDVPSFAKLTIDPEFRRPGRFCAWVGLDANQAAIKTDLIADGAHLLIVGPTGSGKSKLLQLALSSMLAGAQAGQVQFATFDFKGGATFAGNWLGKTVFSVSDLDETRLQRAMQSLEKELLSRESLLANNRCADFLALNAKRIHLPLLIVACDELTELLKQSRLALQTIETIAAKGRSLGVVLIATAQSLTGIPRAMLVNFRQRIALHGTDSIDLVQLGFSAVRKQIEPLGNMHHGGYWTSTRQNAIELRFPVDFNLEN